MEEHPYIQAEATLYNTNYSQQHRRLAVAISIWHDFFCFLIIIKK